MFGSFAFISRGSRRGLKKTVPFGNVLPENRSARVNKVVLVLLSLFLEEEEGEGSCLLIHLVDSHLILRISCVVVVLHYERLTFQVAGSPFVFALLSSWFTAMQSLGFGKERGRDSLKESAKLSTKPHFDSQ